jgi:putative ABC transport system permease protein
MSGHDLDDELGSHLEFQVRKHMTAGMSEVEARRLARIEFGGMDRTKEDCRDVDPWRHVDRARRNMKYAMRSLAKSPTFAAIAIAILGVGIGVTVGAFSVVDALLYRPLGVERPDELVRISSIDRKGRIGRMPSTLVGALQSSTWLRGVCGFNTSDEGAEINGTLTTAQITGFTGDCFRTLGMKTRLGRPILPADDDAAAPAVAVITSQFWRKAFGGRPDAIGQTIHTPGVSFVVVGVTEERFTGMMLGSSTGVIVPLHQEPDEVGIKGRQVWWPVEIFGRRAPGVTLARANAGLSAQSSWLLQHSMPPSYNAGQRRQYLERRLINGPAASGVNDYMGRRFGNPLRAVFGICVVVLVIACVNVAGLMLARAQRRNHEVAVRLALGASRAHVAALLSLESSLLVVGSAALSVLVALGVDRTVVALGADLFRDFDAGVGFDARSVAFLAAVATGIAVAIAGASAWQARRVCRYGDLHASGRRVAYGGGLAQKALIAAQIALTLALVAGAGWFGQSLRALYGLELGVKTDHVWELTMAGRPAGYHDFTPGPYYRELIGEIEAIPGVKAAALTNFAPFYTRMGRMQASVVETGQSGQEMEVHVAMATDGMFSILGMRVLEGRDFRRDETSGERGVVVSQSLAERWGGPAAVLGRHIRLGTAADYQRLLVQGVVSDAQADLSEPSVTRPPSVYFNSWQFPEHQANYPVVLVRTVGGTLPIGKVREVLNRLGREYVDRARSLDSEKDGALVEDRAMAYLSGAFGVMALVLAATGLFGLLSYQVANRTSEIGIRMALGARHGQIEWLVMRQMAGLLACGSAAGIVLSLLAGKAVSGRLFGVHPGDPRLLTAALLVLGATAVAAAWLPARRAASVDPLVALRHE